MSCPKCGLTPGLDGVCGHCKREENAAWICETCGGISPAGEPCATCATPADLLTPKSSNPKDKIGIHKPPLDLVPPALLIFTAEAMKNGAKKYGPYNWRKEAVSARVYIGAALRHLAAWQDGEETAADSGVHHLGHAAACLGILLDAQSCGSLIDDRPAPGGAAQLILRFTDK